MVDQQGDSGPGSAEARGFRLESLLNRGSGFSGIGEAVAAALVLAALLVNPGLGQGFWFTAGLVTVCAVSGLAGRWPYLGLILGSGMLLVLHIIASLPGADVQVGSAYLCAYLLVEAIATTGRWPWVVTAMCAHVTLWLSSHLVVDLSVTDRVLDILLSSGWFLGAMGLGLLRYRRRRDRSDFTARRKADLVALRRDIARDLHDSIAHDVTSIVLLAGQARAETNDPVAADRFEKIIATGQQSLQDLRPMLTVLRREAGESSSARTQVRTVQEELIISEDRLRDAGLTADIRYTGDIDTVAPLVDVIVKCLYELISNVIRHGEPQSTCTVRLEAGASEVELIVLNRVAARSRPHVDGGLGLIGIQERVEAVGGTVESGPGEAGLWVAHLSIPAARRRA